METAQEEMKTAQDNMSLQLEVITQTITGWPEIMEYVRNQSRMGMPAAMTAANTVKDPVVKTQEGAALEPVVDGGARAEVAPAT